MKKFVKIKCSIECSCCISAVSQKHKKCQLWGKVAVDSSGGGQLIYFLGIKEFMPLGSKRVIGELMYISTVKTFSEGLHTG